MPKEKYALELRWVPNGNGCPRLGNGNKVFGEKKTARVRNFESFPFPPRWRKKGVFGGFAAQKLCPETQPPRVPWGLSHNPSKKSGVVGPGGSHGVTLWTLLKQPILLPSGPKPI